MTNDVPPPPSPATASPPPPGNGAQAPAGPPSKLLPILAISLAGLGLILAFAAPGIAWLVCAAAIVVAIIALVKRRQPRGLAIAAIIAAPIAWLIAIIVAVASIASGVGQAIEESDDAPTSASQPDNADPETDAPDAPQEATIGDTITNDDGVSFTVSKIRCGLKTAGDNQFLKEKASGQFCEIKFIVENGSTDSINVSASDVTGSIGDSTYDSNTTASKFGDDYFSTDVNPGLSAKCVVYIDIPKDQKLEFITYDPLFSFGGSVVVAVS